jgi:hypothetical protein
VWVPVVAKCPFMIVQNGCEVRFRFFRLAICYYLRSSVLTVINSVKSIKRIPLRGPDLRLQILSFRTNALGRTMTSSWTVRFRKIMRRFPSLGRVQPIVAHPIIVLALAPEGVQTPWSISSPDFIKNVICFVAVVVLCLRKIGTRYPLRKCVLLVYYCTQFLI